MNPTYRCTWCTRAPTWLVVSKHRTLNWWGEITIVSHNWSLCESCYQYYYCGESVGLYYAYQMAKGDIVISRIKQQEST